VRARADFREPDHVTLHKEFHAKEAAAAERGGDLFGNIARFLDRHRVHQLRLPALDVIALVLNVTDWLAEAGFDAAAFTHGTHGQLGDFVVKINKAFNDDLALIDATARSGVFPGGNDVVRTTQKRLAFA